MNIDWAYLRNGWVSCKKAQKYFELNKIDVKEKSDARKEKIAEDTAWELISDKKQVFIGKGKKVISFEPDELNKAEILKASMGRSGNLRAPSIVKEDILYIGFNETIYEGL